jgi:hypothetical protein
MAITANRIFFKYYSFNPALPALSRFSPSLFREVSLCGYNPEVAPVIATTPHEFTLVIHMLVGR